MKTPYENFKKSKEWKTIQKALRDLAKNKDIELNTNEDYIVGYICLKLGEDETKASNVV